MASLLTQGNRAFEQKDYGRAIDFYQEAILRVPFLGSIAASNLERARAAIAHTRTQDGVCGNERLENWLAAGIHRLAGSRPASPERESVLLVGHTAGRPFFGAERSLIDMARAAGQGAGFNVFVCLPSFEDDYAEHLRPYVSSIFVHDYPWWQSSGSSEVDAIDRFAFLLRSLTIRLVHVNTIMPRVAVLAARQCGIPVIVHAREIIQQDPHLLERLGAKAVEITRAVVTDADWLVCNSGATQRAFGGSERSVVVPNAIDVDAFAARVAEHHLLQPEEKALVVGMVSSNVEKKGVEDFLQLACACIERGLAMRFELIGPLNPYVESLMSRYAERLSQTLNLVGYVPEPAEAISRLDVVCNFAHCAESFGRTVLEGMAAGRVAIVYDHGALPELLEHGTSGWVVPYRQPLAAVDVLARLAEDTELRRVCGSAAQERARAFFDLQQYNQTISALYRQVLEAADAADFNTD